MSMWNRPANGNDIGEVVASMRDYEAAQQSVSKLIAGEVPARDIIIVGQGVRTIERVTGKLGYAAAARSGAINGVLIGLLLSAVMLFGSPDAPISLFLGFVFIGVALGMIMSLVTYAIVRRRRDFASVTQLVADHYEVRVQPGSLPKARQVLGQQRVAPVQPPVDLSEPPRYGERIPQGGQAPTVGPVIPPVPPLPAPAAPASRPGDAAQPGNAASEPGAPEASEGSAPADGASADGSPESDAPTSGGSEGEAAASDGDSAGR